MVIEIVLQFSQAPKIYCSFCTNLSVYRFYIILFSLVFLVRCVSRVNEEWFADEQRVRERVGLLEKLENHETQSLGQSQEVCEVYISHKVLLNCHDFLYNCLFPCLTGKWSADKMWYLL